MPHGRINFFQLAGTNWDPFTSSTDPTVRAFLRGNVTGMGTYTPYFDTQLPWYPNAVVYVDSYAIYNSSPPWNNTDTTDKQHPEWILKNAAGAPLYIPWGCTAGSCPQYAGDISNATFVEFMIQKVLGALKPGYVGVWLDDVNLPLNVSDGNGNPATPIGAGGTLAQPQWAAAFATYLELLRGALPQTTQMIHNSIWYAPAGSSVDKQIEACNYVNLQRGFGDPGLTGGIGQFSLTAFMNFIDHIHARGSSVILQEALAANLEYSIACYFLINTGTDRIGVDNQLPDSSWPTNLLGTDIGSAVNTRYKWNGLWRRDFMGGLCLVNEPGAPTVAVALPGVMYDENGNALTQVNLAAKTGITLRLKME